MAHPTLIDLLNRSTPMAEKKSRWIKDAVKHSGALRKAAERAGESTRDYADTHKHDGGKAGARSRLALTLIGVNHGAKRNKPQTLFNRSR